MGGKTNPETHKRWRDRNKDRVQAYGVKSRSRPGYKWRVSELLQKKRQFLIDSRSQPCLDCHQTYPYYVMEFDHTRGVKQFKVSEMTSRSIDAIILEMEKCDVVCANCHRVRTHERGQLRKGRSR